MLQDDEMNPVTTSDVFLKFAEFKFVPVRAIAPFAQQRPSDPSPWLTWLALAAQFAERVPFLKYSNPWLEAWAADERISVLEKAEKVDQAKMAELEARVKELEAKVQ